MCLRGLHTHNSIQKMLKNVHAVVSSHIKSKERGILIDHEKYREIFLSHFIYKIIIWRWNCTVISFFLIYFDKKKLKFMICSLSLNFFFCSNFYIQSQLSMNLNIMLNFLCFNTFIIVLYDYILPKSFRHTQQVKLYFPKLFDSCFYDYLDICWYLKIYEFPLIFPVDIFADLRS